MDKINVKEFEWSKLRKCQNQGSLSTVYIQDDICIKILDKLYSSEKEQILDKFLAMDGIRIDGVIFPKELIIWVANHLKDKSKRIPGIPYMDDLINRDDDYTIKRDNSSLLIKRLAKKF